MQKYKHVLKKHQPNQKNPNPQNKPRKHSEVS